MKLIGATFCSGIGTPELACPEIDWRFASEIERFPRAVLMHRFGMKPAENGVAPGDHVLWRDFTTVRPRHFRRLGIPIPDIFVAGTPCQAFSIAGLREGLKDPRGNLTLEFVVQLRRFKPKVAVIENVPGLLSIDDGETYRALLVALNEVGYVAEPIILDAQNFGLAQRRERVFIVCHSLEYGRKKRTPIFASIFGTFLTQSLVSILTAQARPSEIGVKSSTFPESFCASGLSGRMRLFGISPESAREGTTTTNQSFLSLVKDWEGALHRFRKEPTNLESHSEVSNQAADTVEEKSLDLNAGRAAVVQSMSMCPSWKTIWDVICETERSYTTSISTKTTTTSTISLCAEAALNIVSFIVNLNPSLANFLDEDSSGLTALRAYTNYAKQQSSDLFGSIDGFGDWCWNFITRAEPAIRAAEQYLGERAYTSALFPERKSLHRDTAARGKARQDVAPTISARAKGGGGLGTDFDLDGGLTAVPIEQVAFGGGNTSDEPRGVSAALTAKGQRIDFEVETFVVSGHGDNRRGESPTLRAAGEDSQGGSEALIKSPTLDQRTTHSLTGEGFDASEDGTGRGTPIVPVKVAGPLTSGMSASASRMPHKQGALIPVQPIPISLQVATRHNALGRGTGFGVGEPAFTISSAHIHGVAVPNDSDEHYTLAVRGRGGEPDIEYRQDGTANAVLTPNGGRAGIGVGAIAFSSKDHGADAMKELSPTLRSGGHSESHANAGVPPAIAFNARQDTIHSFEVTQPLDTDGGTVGDTDSGWRVRRLTVVECEKLQGLPINHTLIPWRGNRAEPDFSETVQWLMSHGLNEEEAISLAGVPDGPRYKAIGNGMALDVVEWILKRLVEFMPDD